MISAMVREEDGEIDDEDDDEDEDVRRKVGRTVGRSEKSTTSITSILETTMGCRWYHTAQGKRRGKAHRSMVEVYWLIGVE